MVKVGTGTERYSKSNETALRVYPAGLSTNFRALCSVISVLAPPDGEGSSGNDVSVVSLLLEYRSVWCVNVRTQVAATLSSWKVPIGRRSYRALQKG